MALEAPLRSSTGGVMSPYSPLGDMSASISSPDSPAIHPQYMAHAATSSESQTLRPSWSTRPHSAHLMSPTSDLVGPSPVTSNGTETTEIEDEVSEETARHDTSQGTQPQLMMIRTNIPDHVRRSLSDEAVSVIHAPQSFHSWRSGDTQSLSVASSTEPSLDGTVTAATSPPPSEDEYQPSPTSERDPPQIETNVRPARYSIDTATPRAQSLADDFSEPSRLRPGSASSLELIPESKEGEGEEGVGDGGIGSPGVTRKDAEVNVLRTVLEECWSLCNSLASLSTIHRARMFNRSGTPDAHEKAWRSCWKLCKHLYNSRDDGSELFNVRTILDLCRDFCQALFEVRERQDDVADSVLRVSFELNNHLYIAQESLPLPEAFLERTLEFYIALCYRMMRQRNELPEETDSLLRSCWTLAEMLFNLRQNRSSGDASDEELLGSAVQACWDLCDMFREGWTQVRPDRGTPRPSQMSFPGGGGVPSDARSNTGSRSSLHSKRDSLRSLPETDRPRKKKQPVVPETPVTEFEDTPVSPESSSPQAPNIMVLGTAESRSQSQSQPGGRWPSSASNLSGYSQRSAKTSSTATTATAAEDINITRIKVLILKAAMNVGFTRDAAAADGLGGPASLQAFVKSLPTGSFGSLPSHATLLQNYKNLVLADTAFRASATLPPRNRRISASDVAKSVMWMSLRSGQYAFLRELFKLVFGFQLEDADARKNTTITV